jgi:cell division protein FtsB
MLSKSRVAVSGIGIALALLAAGCRRGPSAETQAKLAQMTRVSMERDRLFAEVAENARMMSEISADLAKVRIPARQLHVSSESPRGAARDSIVQEIAYITTRLNESERKLRASGQRIGQLTALSDSLRATLQATVSNYETVVEQQKATIAALTDQISQLSADKVALTDTVHTLKEQNNTVYYVIGTRDQLLRKGIVVQEGGSRFPLIFAKLGRTLVPARVLDPRAFTRIDKRAVTEIPLPGSQVYRIASRQDLDALATPPPHGVGGRISGSLRIANPDKFWSSSRFLILIQG